MLIARSVGKSGVVTVGFDNLAQASLGIDGPPVPGRLDACGDGGKLPL